MKTMYRILIITLMLFAMSIVSCKQEPKYTIGVSQCSEDDWRRKLNDEIMREILLHDDIRVEILSADDNSEKQKEDLRYFASGKFDIIIASPNEVDAVTPVLDSIYNAGIPLIIFDRRTNNENYTAFQGADNKAIGQAAAKYAKTLNNTPKVIEIEGAMDTSPAIDRHVGFVEYQNSADGYDLLASADGRWTEDGGEKVADSLLTLYPETNIIYAHNDRMALGAAKVRKRLNRDDIKIIGIDASPEIGLKAVHDSVIDATFIYPSEGRQLIKTAIAILEGTPYEKNLIIPTSTAVDANNAEIMLVQNQALREETNNIYELKAHLNTYLKQHSAQTTLLYSLIIILTLLAGIIFLMLRNFWLQRRSRNAIQAQNTLLSQQKDEIESQNQQLQLKNDEINQMLNHLQQATQSKLAFFTNVSHDLRTPLTLIAEPVSQLSKADNLTSSQHKLMSLAEKNVKVLMRLINQILDLRKYENAKLNLNLTEVNLASELRDWTEAFREVAVKQHLKFKVSIPEDTDNYFIAIDVDKVERVLFNLLANAFKFTPENGTVKVEIYRDESNIYLKVSDNGKGINEEDIKQIFERFFKADKVSPQGSGIGLALSKAFAELHGGTITAESTEGKGSTFIVRLPIRHIESKPDDSFGTVISAESATTELADIESEDIEPSETGATILVIDDNADIRTLVNALMGDQFTVIQASNGTQGIKLATKYVPDLIICDVMMPGIDGIETCRRLKSEITTSHIPVLLLTACALDEQRIAGYDCGADSYLTKPFNSDVLLAQVNSLIENRKRLQQLFMSQTGSPSGKPKEEGKAQPKEGRLPACGIKSKDIDNEFYKHFVELVNANISNSELNVDDIAAQLGTSRVQLYRKLKALTNYSPTDLIRNIRLQQASQMLKTTDTTVSEICYAVGFTSHSYFTKCYREYFGESPSEVQRRTSKPKE